MGWHEKLDGTRNGLRNLDRAIPETAQAFGALGKAVNFSLTTNATLLTEPLIDWLDYNGYTVVTKPAKEFTDASGRRKVKGNMDMELAIDAMELSEVAEKARDRKLKAEDMSGASFTITNLGGIGGTYFTPIVNYPEVAILGMSRGQKVLQLEDDQIVERLMLPLSMSYDHRAINGADAARFIVKLSSSLTNFFELF